MHVYKILDIYKTNDVIKIIPIKNERALRQKQARLQSCSTLELVVKEWTCF